MIPRFQTLKKKKKKPTRLVLGFFSKEYLDFYVAPLDKPNRFQQDTAAP
jgi:hypothetical protein